MLFSFQKLVVAYRLRGLPFPLFLTLFSLVPGYRFGSLSSEDHQRGGYHHRVDIAVEAAVPPSLETCEEKHQLGYFEVEVFARDYPRTLFQLRIGELVFTSAVLG